MKEFLFDCSQKDEQLELKRSGENGVPFILLNPYPPSLPLFKAIGCLSCERMKREARERLLEPRPIEHALYHDEMQHPAVLEQFENGFTISCPLRNKKNVPSNFREENTPCQTIQQISISLPDEAV